MNKLISNNRNISKDRDALSLTFEHQEDNNIKVTKIFFVDGEIGDLFRNDEIVLEKVNVAESTLYLTFSEFRRSILDLFFNTNIFNVCNINNLQLVNEFERASGRSMENLSSLIDDLNDIFFGIHFSLKTQSFEKENYTNKVNLYLKLSGFNDYTEKADDDFIVKPHLDDINDYESELYELRVYNVGQANCSALIKYADQTKQNYKVLFVYDFGCDSRHKGNKDLNNMINKIDSDTFVLISHFHSDHFNNIAAHLLIKTRRWIFPNCYTKAVRANRLFHILLRVASAKTHSGTIYRFPKYFPFSKNISVSEYAGPELNKPIKNKLINVRSLVSTVEINDIKVLIPADATYEVLSPSVKLKQYDYILLPHHGCYYPSTGVTAFIGSIIKNSTVGVVQSGQNSFGHPDINHLNLYKNVEYMHRTTLYNKKTPAGSVSKKTINYYKIKFN